MSIKRALIDVADKTNLHKLAPFLQENGVEIVSWGTTLKYLKQHHVKAQAITPEQLENIVVGNLDEFDLIVMNLNDIEGTINKSGTTFEEAITHIDVASVSVLRQAAKQYENVITIINPTDYDQFMVTYAENSTLSEYARVQLAAKVFAHTAKYDDIIAQHFYVGLVQLRNREKK